MTIDAQTALASLRADYETVAAAVAEKDANLSALSLQNDSLSAANVSLQAQLDTRDQTIAELKAQLDALQPKPVQTWAQKYGVVGDGKTDDTAALQKAIDAGEGIVPAGQYLIDATKTLKVGAGETLTLDPNAVLVVKPNSAPRYCAVSVEGGKLTGGQILGDRLAHTYTSGSTHEWGYGVQVRGTASYVSGVKVSQCTGDGFGVSGAAHLIEDCESTQNRRQGMSVFAVSNLVVRRCKLTKTGALNGQAGTNPRCGVDLEPDSGWVDSVTFEDCDISDNEVTGFVAWIRQEVVGGVRGLVVKNCRITGVNAVHMKALAGSISASFSGCQIKRGSGSGMRIETGVSVAVNDNTFAQPTDRADQTITGMSSYTKYDIAFPAQPTGVAPGKATVGTNRYI